MISAREAQLDRRLRAAETATYGTLLSLAMALLWAPAAIGHGVRQAAMIGMLLAAVTGVWLVRKRRAQHDAMANSAAMFRRFTEDSPDSVVILSGRRIVFVNSAAAHFFDEDEANLIGRDVLEIVHPDDRDLVRARTAAVEENMRTTAPAAIRYLRRDGSTIVAEGRGGPIRFEGRPAIQVVLRDLTARREAEAARRDSEQRFRAVLDAMDEGVVLQDSALRILLWNPAAESILGLSGDQMAGRTSYDAAWRAVNERGKPLPGDEHVASVALRTGLPVSGVMGIDGTPRDRVWIHVNAVPLFEPEAMSAHAVVVTFTDITATRASEGRLRLSEARYRMLADHTADLISRRSADHRFEYASPSHAAVLGYDPEELIGRDPIDMLHPDDVERVRRMRADSAGTGSHLRVTTRMRHRDGHYVWLEAVSTALHTDAGAHDGFIVSARDVTARIALEEELRQSQKMEVLGRMASGVAHDFNNLLTIIRSSTELMRMERSTAGAPSELVDDIEMATDRAAALTSHLLTFSGRMQHAPGLIQPAAVVRGVTPILRRLVSDSAAVDVRLAPDVNEEWIMADVVRFEQVLVNLVGNARDAMPSGGTIHVECDTITLQESITHRFGVIAPGRYLTVSVEDSGIGMTEEVLMHLFDPFYTTKAPGRGTGLGLSIVHGVVQDALGTITVSSDVGNGSRFTIYWPTTNAPATADAYAAATARSVRRPTPLSMPAIGAGRPAGAAPTDGAAEDASDAQRLILLVDDDASVRRVVARQLESCGYRVRVADNGLTALAILRRDSVAISAVVTDVRMPGMGGIELVQTMLVERIRCPALIVSGQMDVPLPPAWPEGALVSFLPKPISGVALRRTLEAMITRSEATSPGVT